MIAAPKPNIAKITRSKPFFDAVKSRDDGSHLTLKPSKTSGYIVRPTGYFHFSPLTRILRSYWSMILLYQYPCNNPDRPPTPPRPITLERLKNGWGREWGSHQFLHKCCISSAILTLAGVKQCSMRKTPSYWKRHEPKAYRGLSWVLW